MRHSVGVTMFALSVMLVGACSSGGDAAGAGGSVSPSATASVAVPMSPPAFTPVGAGTLYLQFRADAVRASLRSVSAQTGEVTPIVGPGSCCYMALSPDWDRILMVAKAADGRITSETMNVDGTDAVPLPLPAGHLNLGPGAWSPDGKRVAFEGWSGAAPALNGIYTGRATDGGDLVRVTEAEGGADDLPFAYSPDGSKILFIRTRSGSAEGRVELWVVHVDGSGLRRLSQPGTWVDPVFGGWPATWSPDGATIAFAAFVPSSSDDARSAVFEITPDGTGPTRITTWGDWTTSARYSPDGRWIAFDRRPVGGVGMHHIYVVHPDGSGLRNVTPDGTGECCAEWSPDSRSLVFIHGGDGEERTYLWAAGIDGGSMRQLTTAQGEYGPYAWGP